LCAVYVADAFGSRSPLTTTQVMSTLLSKHLRAPGLGELWQCDHYLFVRPAIIFLRKKSKQSGTQDKDRKAISTCSSSLSRVWREISRGSKANVKYLLLLLFGVVNLDGHKQIVS